LITEDLLKKLIFAILLVPLLAFGQRSGTNSSHKNPTVEWDYRTAAGVDVPYADKTYSVTATGAGDSLYSRFYDNWGGDVSAKIVMTGGTTKRYQIVVQTAEKGTSALADSLFNAMFWLHYGGSEGLDYNYVTTKVDSISSTGVTSSILIPLLGADKFRFFIRSLSTQSGNTTFTILLSRWGE